MASVAAARSVLRSARNATSRIPTGFKPKAAPSPFGISSQKPLSARIFRSPVEMSSVSVVSMLPYHNATASALLTSMLSVAPCRHGWTLEGIVTSSLNEAVMSSDFVENDDTFDVDFVFPLFDIEKLKLDAYLDEKRFPTTVSEFDILNWWKTNNAKYPVLGRITRDILAVPATTFVFSVWGRVLDP